VQKALPAMADFVSKVFCRAGDLTYEENTAIQFFQIKKTPPLKLGKTPSLKILTIRLEC
jgi:hypothetical protein